MTATCRRPRPDVLNQWYNNNNKSVSQILDVSIHIHSCVRRTASFVTGLLYVPILVLIVTTHTSPSFPAWTSVTRANGHFAGMVLSSCNTTMSPTCIFLIGCCHLVKRWSVAIYSVDHLCQKWRTMNWEVPSTEKRDRLIGKGWIWNGF